MYKWSRRDLNTQNSDLESDAPQDQHLPNSQGESTSHCLRPFNQFNTLLRKFHVNYWFQSIYIDESIERMIHEMSEIRPLKLIKSITIKIKYYTLYWIKTQESIQFICHEIPCLFIIQGYPQILDDRIDNDFFLFHEYFPMCICLW